VDHLDGVHEDGESLTDGHWVAFVERLNEALQSLEVLDIVLSLVKSLGNLKLDTSPVGESKVNTRIRVFVLVTLAVGSEDVLDGSAVLVTELFADLSEHSHAEFPVFELISRAFRSIGVLLARFSLLQGSLDLFRPLLEDTQEVGDHFIIRLGVVVNLLGRLLIDFVVLREYDVAVEGLQGLLELTGELLKDYSEVTLLLGIADSPIFSREFVDEGLIDGVHHSVELQH
jgi:hypothetical protein